MLYRTPGSVAEYALVMSTPVLGRLAEPPVLMVSCPHPSIMLVFVYDIGVTVG